MHELISQRTASEKLLHKLNRYRPTAAQQLHKPDAMKLVPSEPPGRSSRKSRRFAPEMRELRAQGHTFEAIRLALAAAGVHVSNATVQREVARASKSLATAPAEQSVRWPVDGPSNATSNPPPVLHKAAAPSTNSLDTTAAVDMRSGKEIAEAFANGRITNPLVLARLNAKDLP